LAVDVEVLVRLPPGWLVLALAVLIGGSVFAVPGQPAEAQQGRDACPEPNNDFQDACFLKPGEQATGVLQSSDDIDAFRFEALDFGAHVQLALLDPPGPYRLNLADWTGNVIAASTFQEGSEVIDAELGPPGSYYVFVDSKTGEVDPTQPYRLLFQPTYQGAAPPKLLYSREFRPGAEDNSYPSTDDADFQGGGGKVTVVMKVSGSPDAPREAGVTLGPAIADFTITVDARMTNAETAVDAVSFIGFRSIADGGSYRLLTDIQHSAVKLQTVSKDGPTDVTDWVPSDAIDTQGGVNRTVIRAVGQAIRVNVNGRNVLEATGPSAQGGRFELGIITQGEPPIISYDNVLVTSPGS
jgi:hypothetical protein